MTDATPPLDDPLLTTFGRLAEAYQRVERALAAALEEHCDIPHSWFEVLLRLHRSPGGRLTMGDLAGQVALTTGGVTRLLDRMIDAGYVRRIPCGTDRRVWYAAITGPGRRRLRAAAEVHAANLRTVFGDFSQADTARFERLLDRLRTPAGTGGG